MRRFLLLSAFFFSVACADGGATAPGGGAGGVATGGGMPTGGAPPSGGASTGGTAGGATGGSAGAGGVIANGGTAGMATGGTAGTSGGGGNAPTGGTGGALGGSGGTATGGAGAIGGAGGSGGGDGGTGGGTPAMAWLPSWATSIQGYEGNGAANKPDHQPAKPLANNTLRQFVWPTYSGDEIRVQISNEKGEAPLQIQKVHVAKSSGGGGQIDGASDTAVTFGGMASVTVPAGETVWSDAADFPLEKVQLTAITIQFGTQIPEELTTHPGSRTTSYFMDGDAVSAQPDGSAGTRDRWYFINAIEVMAPGDAYAIALLGDSITDGYGITINQFQRWSDSLTLAIQNDPMIADKVSVLNFGMGANNLTVSGDDQDAGTIRFERDVLTRDKVKWVIVLEGVNDINSNDVQAQPIIDAYKEIVMEGHDKGIYVYGSPLTPMNAAHTAVKDEINDSIRTEGYFDAIVDLDAAIRDPNNPNNTAAQYKNDDLHPNVAGYEAMGNAVDLSLFYTIMP